MAGSEHEPKVEFEVTVGSGLCVAVSGPDVDGDDLV